MTWDAFILYAINMGDENLHIHLSETLFHISQLTQGYRHLELTFFIHGNQTSFPSITNYNGIQENKIRLLLFLRLFHHFPISSFSLTHFLILPPPSVPLLYACIQFLNVF